jgi:hypothetical protein
LYIVKDNLEGFIPTLPSRQLDDIEIKYFNDPELWQNYLSTIEILNKVESDTKKLPVKPVAKVIDSEMIVGIITETNQFIELVEPEPDTYNEDGLKLVYSSSYLTSNEEIQISNSVDRERIEYIKKIKLETGFFNAFRNTMRILLNDYVNVPVRVEIEKIINAPDMLYLYKLDKIVDILKKLLDDHVVFVDFEDFTFEEIYGCFNLSNERCKDRDYCKYENDTCRLLIPSNNLVNDNDNKETYYGKISDELLRYNRIKLFIFQPKMFLSFNELSYNLHDDEIILLQSLIMNDYFDDLVPEIKNKYVQYVSYDYANPYNSQNYSLEYINQSLPNSEKIVKETICVPSKKIIYGKLKEYLPLGFKELFYNDSSTRCSFQVVVDILFSLNIDRSVKQVREELIEMYQPLLEKFLLQISQLWKIYGLKELSTILYEKKATLDTIITSEYYSLTNLDLWLFSQKYKLPILLYSPTKLVENGKEFLFLYKDQTLTFYLIQTSQSLSNKNTRIKIIENNKEEIKLQEQQVLPLLQEKIKDAKENYTSLNDFLGAFKKTKKVIIKEL